MRLARRGIAFLVACLAAYLLFTPVPIDPLPWTPTPDAGFTGAFAPNSTLTAGVPIAVGGAGPEDVTLGPDSALYTGLADGRIVRIDRGSGAVTTVFDTDGRPLGLRFDASGALIVADGVKGLLRIPPARNAMEVLANAAGGQRFTFTDAVDVAPDGTIWMSDASGRWGLETHGLMDFWESRPTGRLVRFDRATREATVALDSIDFANGVAVGPNGAWLLLNETMAGRILRYWITGPRAGEHEVFLEGLPGMPDNIGYDGKGTFWVALFAPRTEEVTKVRSMSPFMRKVLYRIPERLRLSGADRYGMVLGIDTLGRVRYNVQDPTGKFYNTTTAVAVGDALYVGSLTNDVIARVTIGGARTP